ncbi:helix-turn-helix domain-containing protein [Labrys okinawensis]|uniref:AraC family transcriptional regulator n=1 Tax=Labrys okinawensis TaxID=346911 RepID=UPI0039BD5DE9
MIFLPLPFICALLFLILLVQMLRHDGRAWHDNPFFLLLSLYVLQSLVIGLHWGYGLNAVIPLQAVLAALNPAMAWISFRSLSVEESGWHWKSVWPHLLPAMLVLALILLWPHLIDIVVTLTFLGYGSALAWLAYGGPDRLVAPRLDGVLRSYRSLQVTAFATLVSVVTDLAISVDMAWLGGAHAAAIVAALNVVALLILGSAASVAGSSTVSEPEEAVTSEPPRMPAVVPEAAEEDREVAAALDALMVDRKLYRDTDLNLGRLARKLGQPARRVSSAVNRIHGMSVSHYVNKHRIEEACRLLAATDESVINVMMDAGFLSKSNFNREFLRVTGATPIAWRRQNRLPLAAE